MLEENFQEIASYVALGIEAVVVIVLLYAAGEAILGMVKAIGHRGISTGARREVWFRFALWIILALEFALAADIIRSAIAPTWESIGQLAAIAAIRTFLNFFLVRDIESYNEGRTEKDKVG
ncbi:DUF1622 domain-containing protein [Sandaracinobacteroides hominis]|uniref:DUF1622 domain-containing protein n=1 Tax=Sandaracinobacteroides hominis TaxID=2780086 RepID=UPI0018F5AF76|nr:DUF1622 domain-containing protein [Sandaracinobacteroides hominis]